MDKKLLSGKYEIVAEIARGGMGVIYKAVHTTLGRQVAIKVLHPQYSGDPAFLKRFMREARAMARLDHENIIRVFDVTEDNASHYIVMEYFPGADLKRLLLEKGRFQAQEVLSIIYQVTSALSFAHAHGIIHRDIKLGNIMMDNMGRAKIADFGIAAAADEISVTVTGQIIGTPEYMSPEQARGEHLDGRSDLYSLGIVIYEMLTGQTPYEGVSRMAIVGKLLYEQEDLALSFPQDVPQLLQDLVRQLLKKRLNERITDANTLMIRIREVAAGIGGIRLPEATIPVTGPQPAPVIEEEEGATVMLNESASQSFHTPAPTPHPFSTPAPSAPVTTRTTPVPPLTQPPVSPATPPPSSTIPPYTSIPASTPSLTTPYPSATPTAEPARRYAGKSNLIPIIGGAAGVVVVIGGLLYFLSSYGEKTPPPHKVEQQSKVEQQPGKEETGTVSLSQIRETQLSIRKMQDTIATSILEADKANARRFAPKVYKEAMDLKDKGTETFQDGGRLINLKQYKEAGTVLEGAVSLLTQANDGFIRARDISLEETAKKEKEKAEREKQVKKTAPKQPEPSKEAPAAPVHVAKPLIPAPGLPSQSARPVMPAPQPPAQIAKPVTPAPSAAAPAPHARPDMEVVGELLGRFKKAYESRDMASMNQVSEMSEGRVRFLHQLFQDYSTIRISITDFSLTGDSASAAVSITKLVNKQGEAVTPTENWKYAKVILRKEGNEWGKIIW